MPDVTGMTRQAASDELNVNGLIVGINEVNHPTVPVGNVISQFPVAGASVPGGTVAVLTISKGP